MASVLKVNELQHTGGTSALTVDSSGRINQPALPVYFWQGGNEGNVSIANLENYFATDDGICCSY